MVLWPGATDVPFAPQRDPQRLQDGLSMALQVMPDAGKVKPWHGFPLGKSAGVWHVEVVLL